MTAQNEFRALVGETTSMAAASGLTLDKLRGTALFDVSRDAQITSLASFDKAKQAITSIPDFVTRFGTQETTRVILQFVYQ